jgi:hypothetical protein
MLVAVNSEPKETLPSNVSTPDRVSNVELASSLTSFGPSAAAGRTSVRGETMGVTLRLNFDGPAEHARRAATRAEPELATGARIGATRAVHAIAIAIAVCLGLLALLPSAWRTDRK